ncbi:MAG: HAD family hydrolase [Coriobacteriia bacterium]|nr:HAD family hydrolase [Coriobacteriia bacterium]
MTAQVQMRRRLPEYRALVLDVDGTLYGGAVLRAAMALELAVFFLTHPWRLRELRALRYFRTLHNGGVSLEVSNEQACYDFTAQRYHLIEAQLCSLVDTWLTQRPLKYVRLFRNRPLLKAVARLQQQGTTIALYSDYPTAQKAATLDLDPDFQFCAADPAINCFKPDRRGMEHILHMLGLPATEVLMIGDCDEKDGAIARAVGMDYLITSKSRQARGILRTAARAGGSDQEAPLS